VFSEDDYIIVVGSAYNSSSGETENIVWEYGSWTGEIFSDGFESGDLTSWSSSTGAQ
jgi:hypothetical protein